MERFRTWQGRQDGHQAGGTVTRGAGRCGAGKPGFGPIGCVGGVVREGFALGVEGDPLGAMGAADLGPMRGSLGTRSSASVPPRTQCRQPRGRHQHRHQPQGQATPRCSRAAPQRHARRPPRAGGRHGRKGQAAIAHGFMLPVRFTQGRSGAPEFGGITANRKSQIAESIRSAVRRRRRANFVRPARAGPHTETAGAETAAATRARRHRCPRTRDAGRRC